MNDGSLQAESNTLYCETCTLERGLKLCTKPGQEHTMQEVANRLMLTRSPS